MEKTISTNQASLILIIFTVSLKLSVLPAITCDFANNDAYIVALIACIIDFLLTIAIIVIMQKIPQKNFFELTKETLSKPVAIIVCIFLFVYFFLIRYPAFSSSDKHALTAVLPSPVIADRPDTENFQSSERDSIVISIAFDFNDSILSFRMAFDTTVNSSLLSNL